MKKLHVIVACHQDNSGYDVLRAFTDKARAERDFQMLQWVAMPNIFLHEVEWDDETEFPVAQHE